MTFRIMWIAAAAASSIIAAAPAGAQLSQSASYKFLQAVREGKGQDVLDILNKPGAALIDTKDSSTGEGALHIVVRRGDTTYLRFLLQHGADPNIRDRGGNTPLLLAVTEGQQPCIDILVKAKADVNRANDRGETPLIRAVQRRDVAMVRELLADGADADQTDNLAGQSARDYAHADSRSPAIAKIIDAEPKKVRKSVSGPKL